MTKPLLSENFGARAVGVALRALATDPVAAVVGLIGFWIHIEMILELLGIKKLFSENGVRDKI